MSGQIIVGFLWIQVETKQRQNMPKGSPTRTPRKATHHLLVGEHRAVVDQCHAVGGVAALTRAGLCDAAAVNLHLGCMGAHLALKEGLLHLWNQLRCPDHHPTDGDELVNVCKEERKDSLSISQCPWLSHMWYLPELDSCQGRSGSAVKPRRTIPGGTEIHGDGWSHR